MKESKVRIEFNDINDVPDVWINVVHYGNEENSLVRFIKCIGGVNH